MDDMKKLLKEEMKKPFLALKFLAIFSLKMLALWFLRMVLWVFFFCLPVVMFLFSSFHAATENLREKTEEIRPAGSKSQAKPINLRTLQYDLRYWKGKFERWIR